MSAGARRGVLKRPLTSTECPWLTEDIQEGKVVFLYTGHTYGCVSHAGIAVTDKPDEDPFYEVPRDCVEWTAGPASVFLSEDNTNGV